MKLKMYLLLLWDEGEIGPHTSAWISWSFLKALQELCLGIVSLCCLPVRHEVHIYLGDFRGGRPVTRCLLASVHSPWKFRWANLLCQSCASCSETSLTWRHCDCEDSLKMLSKTSYFLSCWYEEVIHDLDEKFCRYHVESTQPNLSLGVALNLKDWF